MNKLLGAILLIAGCCVGAGMLGIPVVTGAAGFYPSMAYFGMAWGYMALTGLVLGKLVLSFKQSDVHLISMAKNTLGRAGALASWLLFAFLFYAIMTAYVIASGSVIGSVTGLPFTTAGLLLVLAMYVTIARGVRLVDSLNRYLMFGMIAFYLLLVIFGLPAVDTSRLERADFQAGWISLPILVISFGYHNLIPSLASYLNGNWSALRKAILIGSLIPLVIYVVWELVILGIVPDQNIAQWATAEAKGELVTQVLVDTVGSKLVIYLSQGFAFFAIATSFLPVSFSFLDFLRDGFGQIKKGVSTPVLALFVLVPPTIIALSDPYSFLDALDFAGGFCAVSIFGILPVLMAWKRKIISPILAIFLLVLSGAIFTIELLHQTGVL